MIAFSAFLEPLFIGDRIRGPVHCMSQVRSGIIIQIVERRLYLDPEGFISKAFITACASQPETRHRKIWIS